MRNLVLSIAASAALFAAAPLANAQTAPEGRLIFGVESLGAPAPVQDVQFLFGGRNYCWYPVGWHGAGYYWCGYANRRGIGWGGPVGWHGWSGDSYGGHGGPIGHIAVAHGGPVGGHGSDHGGDHGGAPAGGHPGGGDHGGGGGHGGGHDGGH
jgi:hypothetical protein